MRKRFSSVRRHALRGIAVLAASCAGLAWAQAYPTKPIRILVGVTTGGTTDTLARFLAQSLSRDFGQPVIVENRPGAGGNIAGDVVAKSPPDGYTLLFVNTAHTVNMGLYGDAMPYDSIRDFTPITQLSTGPNVLVVHPSFPANTLTELIALAKANPGKYNTGIGGTGTSVHMAGELFRMMAGVDIVNVPYKGTAPAMTDVVGGQIQMMFAPVITAVPMVKSGRLKALGVTSKTRNPALPDVPPIADLLPGYESIAYFGLLAPAKLPAPIVEKLSVAASKVAKSKEFDDRLSADGAQPVGNTPAQFAAFLAADVEKWKRVVKATGAKPE